MAYPANVSTVTVTGKWALSSGSTAIPTGYLTFTPNVQLKDSGTGQILEMEPLTVALDGTGSISAVLMATDDPDLSPSGWAYTITEAIAGRVAVTYTMQFPASQTPVDLASKAPLASPPALVAYPLDTTVVHNAGDETVAGIKTFSSSPVVPTPTTAGQAASKGYADTKLAAAANLSDVASAGTSRTNLGLGGAAVLNVGAAPSTVAAGDDSRITGAAQKSANLSDLANAASARTNLGLGTAAVWSVEDIREYTVTQSPISTPAGILGAFVTVIDGGGGGGSGRRGAAATVRCGGGGGASGSSWEVWVPAANWGGTYTVTIGAGGTGGAARTVNDTDGAAGGAGGLSSVATGSVSIGTSTPGGGSGGTNASGSGGGGAGTGGNGGAASTTGGTGSGGNFTGLSPGSGAAGGGITSGDVASNGGAGGQVRQWSTTSGPSGGVVGGASPGNGASPALPAPGTGGGGGAASIIAAAQAGGNGGDYGGGGGGGGASLNGSNSGAGGNGGNGYARVRFIYV